MGEVIFEDLEVFALFPEDYAEFSLAVNNLLSNLCPQPANDLPES